MKIKLYYILLTIIILFGSCKKDNTKLINMSNREFINFISNDDDFTKGIARIDSIINTKQKISIHKTGLLYLNKAEYLFKDFENIKTIAYTKKALLLFEKEKHKQNIAVSYNLLGKANMYLKKYNIAEEQLKKAHTIFIEKNDIRNQMPALQALAYIALQKKNPKKAMAFLEKSIELAYKINDSNIIASSYNNIGYINETIDNKIEAIESYKKAILIKEKNNSLDSSTLTNLGSLYFSENKLQESIKLYEQALAIVKKKKKLKLQKKIYDFLIDSIAVKHPKFNYLYPAYTSQRDSIKSLITERENEAKIKEVENQNKLIDNEINLKHQKTLKKSFIIGFIIILIPIIGLLYMYYQKIQNQIELNKVQEEVNQKEIEALQKDQELNLIKASIKGQDKARERIAQELHDSIGGNLAGIKLQLSNISKRDEKYKTIAKQIDDTYEQVREISHNLIPQKFNENIFTTLIENYIGNIQKGSKIKITFNPHPKAEINVINKKIKATLFNIIQELLTNVIKHAEATQIDIHINKFEQTIKLLFEDNGKGFNPETVKNGIGFTNIKSRLNKISGTIHIDSFKGRGTILDIDIPIIKTN